MIVNASVGDYTARFTMPIECDYHMHTARCKHATGPMEVYVERGIALGLKEIGFSDHNPLPRGLNAHVRMAEHELDEYVKDVLRLHDQYRGQIDVLLGLEMDYLEGLESYCEKLISRYPWDYIIGSVHFLDPECLSLSWPRNFEGDPTRLYFRYFELLRKLVRTGMYDIIAHFDIPKRSGRPHTNANEADIRQTLEEIARAELCMEINTSGYRHKELVEPQSYPSLSIANQAIELGIHLTVNSDAHAPEHVGTKFPEVEHLLKTSGCRSLVRFKGRQRSSYAL